MDELNNKIIGQVYTALEDLGAGSELLAIVGSWGDTLDDSEVLDLLESYNTTGTSMSEIICDVNDTPATRRARFKVIT